MMWTRDVTCKTDVIVLFRENVIHFRRANLFNVYVVNSMLVYPILDAGPLPGAFSRISPHYCVRFLFFYGKIQNEINYMTPSLNNTNDYERFEWEKKNLKVKFSHCIILTAEVRWLIDHRSPVEPVQSTVERTENVFFWPRQRHRCPSKNPYTTEKTYFVRLFAKHNHRQCFETRPKRT